MIVQNKHKPCYILGLYVRQELRIVAIRKWHDSFREQKWVLRYTVKAPT